MQISFTIDLSHLKATAKALAEIEQRPERLLGTVGEAVLNVHQDRHKRGENPDGSKWVDLKPATWAAKKKKRMLVEGGDMLGRFTYQIKGTQVVVGTNDFKAVFHHYGTKPYVIKPKTKKALKFGGVIVRKVNHPGLPARQLVGFEAADKTVGEEAAADYLTAILRRA